MRFYSTLFVFAAFLAPKLAGAQGLVPCGNPGQPDCQVCDVVTLVNNIVNWLVGILTLIFTIMIIVAGLRLVTSTGNANVKVSARKMLITGILGFIIVLSAWIMIDFLIKVLLSPGAQAAIGPWNSLQCQAQS